MYEVGQQLWMCLSRHRSAQRYVSIEKVGRKWLHLEGGYIADYELNIVEKDFGTIGRCFISKEQWEEEVSISQEWQKLRQAISSYRPPKGITLEDITKAKELLRL